MKRARILVLLGLLVLAVVFTFTAGSLPGILDSGISVQTTNTFAETVLTRAKAGDARAQYSVGVQFAKAAFGREKDDVEARHWFEKAAEQGFDPAQVALARLHAWDFVIDRNRDSWAEAANWYRRAADAGSIEAQYEFGATLVRVGISKVTLRYGWDRQLVDLNFGRGVSLLAEPLMEPGGILHQERDPNGEQRANANLRAVPEIQEGMKWLRSLANRDFVDAQVELADLLKQSSLEKMGSEGEERHWRMRAASLGHVDSMCEIGEWYKWPTRNNFSEAVKWLEKAADGGSFRAMDQLAELHAEGKGVPKDAAQAARLYQGAAGAPAEDPWIRINFPSICLALGFMAEQGDGLPRDLIEAYKWYNLATSSGGGVVKQLVKQHLARVSNRLTLEQIAEAQKRSTDSRLGCAQRLNGFVWHFNRARFALSPFTERNPSVVPNNKRKPLQYIVYAKSHPEWRQTD